MIIVPDASGARKLLVPPAGGPAYCAFALRSAVSRGVSSTRAAARPGAARVSLMEGAEVEDAAAALVAGGGGWDGGEEGGEAPVVEEEEEAVEEEGAGGGDATGGGAAKRGRKPRGGATGALVCQVPNCATPDLEGLKRFMKRYRICEACMKASEVRKPLFCKARTQSSQRLGAPPALAAAAATPRRRRSRRARGATCARRAVRGAMRHAYESPAVRGERGGSVHGSAPGLALTPARVATRAAAG